MSKKCERCTQNLCAAKVPIFSTLTREELIEIIKMTGHRSYKKGDTILFEGSPSDALYIINKGRIKLFKDTKDGKEQILNILSDGDFFGELNLFNEGTYNFSAQTVVSTNLCTLTKDKMKQIILDKPEIGLKILEVVGNKLTKLQTLAQNLATNDVEVRIAHLIWELKEQHGVKTPKGIEINLPMTREDMSHYTGVARETISRKLKKFQDEGIIQMIGNRKLLILNEERLEAYI